jgi:hypothetical protein
VRTPFENLMRLVASLPDEDWALPLGVLAERWDEPVGRIADAIDANRVFHGERTSYEVRDHGL